MTCRTLVDVYCDGNASIGYGHVRRSMTLARQLEKDGFEVRLLGLSEDAKKMLPLGKLSDQVAQAVVFDSPGNISALIREANDKQQLTVALDWFGETLPQVNIVVFPHAEVRALSETHTGFRYILIREEIVQLTPSENLENSPYVLVLLGGGDVLQQSHSVADQLTKLGLDVILVQGPLAKSEHAETKYRVFKNPPDLPKLLNECAWAVTNGGGSLFEALSLGKATFVLPQTNAESVIANCVLKENAVLGVGIDKLRVFSSDEIKRVSGVGPALVDGRGAERISQIVRRLL